MAEKEKVKEINTNEVANYLNRAFAKAASKAAEKISAKAVRAKNVKGIFETTPMYDYQVDFCYLIDNIQRSPGYIIPKYIQQANELISKLEAEAS